MTNTNFYNRTLNGTAKTQEKLVRKVQSQIKQIKMVKIIKRLSMLADGLTRNTRDS